MSSSRFISVPTLLSCLVSWIISSLFLTILTVLQAPHIVINNLTAVSLPSAGSLSELLLQDIKADGDSCPLTALYQKGDVVPVAAPRVSRFFALMQDFIQDSLRILLLLFFFLFLFYHQPLISCPFRMTGWGRVQALPSQINPSVQTVIWGDTSELMSWKKEEEKHRLPLLVGFHTGLKKSAEQPAGAFWLHQ